MKIKKISILFIVSRLIISNGGLEGSRTPVLTKLHPTFYMLILLCLVHLIIPNKQRITRLSAKSRSLGRSRPKLHPNSFLDSVYLSPPSLPVTTSKILVKLCTYIFTKNHKKTSIFA